MLWSLDQQLEAANGLEGSLDALAKVLPTGLIEDALDAGERSDQRIRKLPLRVVMWLVVGSLYRDLNIQNVLRRLVDGLGLVVGWGRAEVPHTTSIAHARDRLGWETVRELFRRFASMLRDRFSAADRWKDLFVYVIDGTGLRTADTEANEVEFGRPGGGRGKGAFPQLRGVLLMGAWSHLVLGAFFGHWRMGELTLATHLLDQIQAGSLLLADRLYYSFAWLAELAGGERFFVVRAKTGKRALKVSRRKAVGRHEWTGVLRIPPYLARKRPGLPSQIEVRLIKLRRKGFRDIELVTKLPAGDDYTAAEIGALYLDRWEIELGIREIKCVLSANSKPTFRSHEPDRVKQETYGLLVAYNCVRALMAEAAEEKDIQPRRLSFTDCLAQIRLFLPIMAHVDASLVPGLYEAMLDALAACELPSGRKGRTCPREVKTKMSNYKKKRAKAA